MPISAFSSLTHCYHCFPSPVVRPRTTNPTISLRCNYLSSTIKSPLLFHTKNPLTTNRNKKVGTFTVSMSFDAGVGVMGTKLGMMSYFETDGKVVPVTVIGFREGNIVTQIKTEATDGYDSVQVGYRRVRDRKLTKPELGHLEKAGIIPMRHLQEFRLQSVDGFEVGQKLDFEELFKEGDLVDISGTTIGKGFQDDNTEFLLLLGYMIL